MGKITEAERADRVCVRLGSKEARSTLYAAADAAGVTPSEAVRQAVEKWLQQEGTNGKNPQ